MKKNVIIWIISLFIISSFVFITNSCEKDEDSGYTCETSIVSGESVKVCCNPISCYYEWDGKKYYCNGVDCQDAAEDLTNDILGLKSSVNREELFFQLLDLKYMVCN